MSGCLYIVPTPIGNLKDITYRAVEVLKEVDEIACEDTRHSLVLLNHYQIKKTLFAFHKFNASRLMPEMLSKLKNGKNIALISDAGMPAISDPGVELVKLAIENNINYTVLPGASAFVNAVVLAGVADKEFMFIGFLPEKNKDRKELLQKHYNVEATLIFYISPHSINADIEDVFSVLGDRKIAIVKEISKMNERVEFSTLKEGLKSQPRGEYVLLCEGANLDKTDFSNLSPLEHIEFYEKMGMSKNDAIKQVAKDRKLQKNDIYQLVHNNDK